MFVYPSLLVVCIAFAFFKSETRKIKEEFYEAPFINLRLIVEIKIRHLFLLASSKCILTNCMRPWVTDILVKVHQELQTFDSTRRFAATQTQQHTGGKVADFNFPDHSSLFWTNKSVLEPRNGQNTNQSPRRLIWNS